MRCVDPFTEGQSAWKNGMIGFLTRGQGIALTVILTASTMGFPWWWPKKSILMNKYEILLSDIVLSSGFTIGTILIIGFLYLRRRTIRSLDIKAILHNFTHYLRDHQTRVLRKTSQRDMFDKEDSTLESFREYMDHICEYAKDYFVLMTHDNTINCAIRLAVEIDAPEGKGTCIVYRTIGRSSGLSQSRSDNSEDISANQGIPRYLIDSHDCKAVLRYNDIEESINIGVFKKTENEEKFKDEIKTFFVAPMNAWDGKKRSMIGLLYITSKQKSVFKQKHIDCMRFIGDVTASSVAFTINRFKECGLIKTIRRVQ